MSPDTMRQACEAFLTDDWALPYDPEDVDALLAFAKAQRAAGLIEGAQIAERGHFLSTDSPEYKFGVACGAAIRRRAKELEGG